MYVCVTLTLSILTITQRHGVVHYNVSSKCSVWVVVGQGMEGGVKYVRVGGWGTFVVVGGGGG